MVEVTLSLNELHFYLFTFLAGKRPTIDPCHRSPCVGNSDCISDFDGAYTCKCPSGYSGIHCEVGKY